jgi:Endomembrane protein 70
VTSEPPCRATKAPHEIPPIPWYRGALPQVAVIGFLPFAAIYSELLYIFMSIWGRTDLTGYFVLFVAFCVLLVVTAAITAILTSAPASCD